MNKRLYNLARYVYHLLRKIYRLFWIDWYSTIRINSKLPFRQAIKLPIFAYRCKIDSLKGRINIDSDKVYFGMIRLGLRTTGLCGNKNGMNIDLWKGTLTFKGAGYIGNNSAIAVGENAELVIGKNFGITATLRIACRRRIEIGENFSCSWDVQIFDTDFHNLIEVETGKINEKTKHIVIGDNVWIGNRCTILKGAHLPTNCVLACGSILCANPYKDENCIYSGGAAKPIKYGWRRKGFRDIVKEPDMDVVRYLRL